MECCRTTDSDPKTWSELTAGWNHPQVMDVGRIIGRSLERDRIARSNRSLFRSTRQPAAVTFDALCSRECHRVRLLRHAHVGHLNNNADAQPISS